MSSSLSQSLPLESLWSNKFRASLSSAEGPDTRPAVLSSLESISVRKVLGVCTFGRGGMDTT